MCAAGWASEPEEDCGYLERDLRFHQMYLCLGKLNVTFGISESGLIIINIVMGFKN